MNVLRNRPVFEDLYIFWVNVNAYRVDYIPEVFDVVHAKSVSFLNCLHDILRQFTIVGSLKEQAQQHREHKDFP